jgi:hypothetical protein
MTKKGEKQPAEIVAARAAAVSKALKGKPQSPEHIAARFEGLAKVRAATVRVSRNDAAMLEVARQFFTELRTCSVTHRNLKDGVSFEVRFEEIDGFESRYALACAWLDGEDVLLAKLAQE